jgi:hypothetical protein
VRGAFEEFAIQGRITRIEAIQRAGRRAGPHCVNEDHTVDPFPLLHQRCEIALMLFRGNSALPEAASRDEPKGIIASQFVS